ncbi:MAG: leucyl/phenylalanyl-tRNA--protein transferase [Melioribacteraceae bacterium]
MSSSNDFRDEGLLIPENMIMMYAQGAFPMADETGKISWYMPDLRTIIPINEFNIPRSLKKYLSSALFEYQFDQSTLEIIRNCAGRDSTWISEKLIEAYGGLIKSGHLHSVGVFFNNELVGGLYGVTFRGAFFGESMFSKVTQASKCALVKLIERLREKNFVLLDVQYQTGHLKMFGAKEIPFDHFTRLLTEAYGKDVYFG